MILDNEPSAGGILRSGEAAEAAPDGYTILWEATSTHSTAPSRYNDISYPAEKDFAPITKVETAINALIVTPNLPVKDEQWSGSESLTRGT